MNEQQYEIIHSAREQYNRQVARLDHEYKDAIEAGPFSSFFGSPTPTDAQIARLDEYKALRAKLDNRWISYIDHLRAGGEPRTIDDGDIFGEM